MRQHSMSQYIQMNLPAGTEEEVCVCHITDPEHFYCHLARNSGVLDSMMDEIDKFYSPLGPSDHELPQRTLGTSCIAKYTLDGGWYRAEITGMLASGSLEVKFVDYGNSESVAPDDVKAIQDKFLQIPVMGLKCSLSGVSTQQGYWSPEHIVQFEDVALDQTFTAFVNSCNSDGVFMLELTNSSGKNLNKEFGLKTNTICIDDSAKTTSHRKIMMGQGDASLQVIVSRDRKHDHNVNGSINHTDDTLGKKTDLPKGQTEVKVASVYTPSEFWCHPQQNCKKLTNFAEKMNIDYEKLSPHELVIDCPTVGMHCVAKFPEDQSWYRGEIVGIGAGSLDIYFIDYGNTTSVPKDSLKQMLPELRIEPPFGIKCCLCNVKPHSSSWKDEASDEFENLTLDKQMVATVLEKSKEGVMQITLTDSLGGFDIGEKLAEMKHAVLVTSGSKDFPKLAIKVPSSFEVYLSSIESPETFWVQLSEKQAQLDELVEKIEGFYSSKGTLVKSVHQGMPVVAQFSEDGAWYRAVVTKSSGGKHDVFFVDFGNSDCVASDFLKEVTEEVMKEPAYAVQCSLKGVAPLKQNSNWHPDAKSLLEDITKDGAICKFIALGSNSYIVDLDANGKDVASFLTSSAVARKSPSVEPCLIIKKGFPNVISIPIKCLEKGYISHVDSPESFWVQLSKFTAQLDELMEGLEAHYSAGHGVQLTSPSVGMQCVAKYSADNAWYRAAVKEVHSSGINVHFVDYGNSEIIDPSVVCEIGKQFLDIPTQAIHCKLALSMSSATRKEVINEKFFELVLEKELVIKVLNGDDGILMVDVLDAGQSVVGLLRKEFSSTNSSREPTPSSSCERFDFPPTEVPVGKTKRVYVSYIEDPGLFYVHADCDDLLNNIMDKLSKQYGASSEPILKNPAEGQPCCALYAEDGAWYRGKVVSSTGDMVKVQFVDYGNADKISKDSVKQISSTHLAIPPLAIQCSLDGVKPVAGAWTEDAIAFMEELTVDKELRCDFKTSKTVKLIAGEDDIGEKLKEKGFAKNDAVVPSPSLSAGKACIFKKQKIPSGSVVAYVSHVDTNETFYLQMASDDDAIVNLSGELLEYYSNSGSPISMVKQGTMCCAQFSDDDAWYRAVVERVSGGCATVRFVDYGNTDVSALKHLKQLEPKFCELPPFAFVCKFEDFTSWPVGAQVKFTADTENKELDVKFLSTVEPYTVSISLGGTDLRKKYASADTPAIKAPPKSSFGSKPNFGEEKKSGFEKPQPGASFEQKPSFGKPPAQSLSDAPKPGFGKPSQPSEETAKKPSFGGFPQKPSFGSPAQKAPMSPPKKEVEVIPIEEQKFKVSVAPRGQIKGYISHVEDDIVYIQQSKNIQSVLDTSEKIRKLPDGTSETTVGHACGAMFTEDKTWYRAEVIEVADDKITVRFVDFGNKDTLSVSSMKPLNRELLWQEPKAFPCKIVGIDALTPELVNILADVTADKEIVAEFCSQEAPFSVKLEDLEDNDIASILCPTTFPVQVAPTEIVHGEVVNVLSTGIFYVCLRKDKELVDQVKNELEADFSSVQQVDTPQIEVGNAYCAKSLKDAWQRAVVKNITEDEVSVQLIDLGAFCSLHKSNIFPLHRRFLTFPGLAYECILRNFRSWTDEQKEKFVEMTKNKTMNVQFLSKTSPFKVELTISIGEELLGEPEPEASQDVTCEEPSTKASAVKLPPHAFQDGVTAYVSFVDTDGSVYIQLSDEEEKLNSVTEQLQIDYKSGGKPLVPVAVGSICCAKFTEDDAWYRAVTTSLNGDQVTVRFVDYGNSDVMPPTRICSLSNQHLQVPALAYHCKLHRCESWTEESVAALDKVVKDQPLTVKLISGSDVFTVELYLDDGSSVTSHLQLPLTEKRKTRTYKHIDLELGKKTNVHISHVESIFTFYVQPVKSEDDLTSLAASIGEHYAAETPDDNVEWMKLGTACVAKYNEDEQWYRGIITSVDEKKCGVHFVDYGNADIINKANVRQLKDEYRTLPAQAVQCKLIVDVADDKLDDASDALLEMTSEKVVSVLGKCQIIEDEHDVVVVDVLDEDKSISAALIVTGLCSAVIVEDATAEENADTAETVPTDDATAATDETTVPTDDANSTTDDATAATDETTAATDETTAATADEALKEDEKESSVCEAETVSTSLSESDQTDSMICPLTNLIEGQRLSVFISSVHSPSSFYVQLDKQKHSLNKVINTMFEYYNNLAETEMVLESPAVGKFCAVYGEDDSWCRGKITSVGDKCTVCFIDHGSVDDVNCSALKTLSEQFESLPRQAVECSLASIKSSDEAWSDDAVTFFQELISHKGMLMDVIGLGTDGAYIVNLIHMGLPITQKLMDKGYGMEFSTPIINTRVKRVFSDSSETQTPVKLVLDEQDASLSDVEDKFEDCTEEVEGQVKLRYVQSELKEGEAYSVSVTQVTDPSTFFCRLTSTSQSLLDLQEDIQKNNENLTKLNPDDIKPKMVVIVKTKEASFYRAEILSVDQDSVNVMLVDHGQQETVSLTDVWKISPEFAASKVNVFRCCLASIKPLGDSWTESASKMFQEITSEKELMANVVSKKTTCVAVELIDDNHVPIGQTLIEDQHASADVSVKTSAAISQYGDESSSRIFGLANDDSQCLGIESINEDTFFGQPLLESTTVIDVADDQYPLLRLYLEKEYDIKVLEDGSPDNFAVHLLEQSSQLSKVKEALSSVAEMEEDMEISADVDKPCLVRIGDLWHRGKITEKNTSTSKVLLVDYYKIETVDNENIRKLPSSLLEMPIQALPCTLAHIAPVDKIRWTEDAIQFFRDFVSNRQLGAIVTTVTNDLVYSLRISDVEDLGGFSINRQLVDLRFAEPLPGSLIEIEIQLEQTQDNSDMLDELEQSFHEVSYHRKNSYGSEPGEAEGDITDELGETFNTTGHSFSSILLDDTRDTTQDNTLELVGDTSVLPELLTPLPDTPLPDTPLPDVLSGVEAEVEQTDKDDDGTAAMDTANNRQQTEDEQEGGQDASVKDNEDNDGNIESVEVGTEHELERDAGDSDGEVKETDHDITAEDDHGNLCDDVKGEGLAGTDTQKNDKTEEQDEILKQDGKEIAEAEDNDDTSCREFIERKEDSDGMPSERKREDVEESSDTESRTVPGDNADVSKSDSDVACTRLVSELVEAVSGTLSDSGDNENGELKDSVRKDEDLEVKDELSVQTEPGSGMSDEFCEADSSSSDPKNSKDGDVDS